MSAGERLPAEVRAARRALGEKHGQGEAPGRTPAEIDIHPSIAIAYAPIGPAIESLLEEMLTADKVDILGVLPWPCAERLIELETHRTREGQPVIHPHGVRYVTPARDRITMYRHSGVLGRVVQRWVAGITGLRNWLRPALEDLDALTIFEFDDMFLDCIIHTKHGPQHQVTIISQLPPVKTGVGTGVTDEATLVVSAMPTEQVAGFLTHLESLVQQSLPLAPRQVLCGSEQALNTQATDGNEFRPTISNFNPYTRPKPAHSIEPAVAIAVCVSTARGPAVLLKRRTVRNSRDDFGLLSLISERVLVEDLADLFTGPVDPDLENALEDLWLNAGQPESFEVPESAFRRAAQRDLFMSCGLDIAADRLDFRGTCLVEREGEDSFLGFYVFRLDLLRSAGADELAHARKWSPDLEVVPLRALYSNEMRPKLNRLLRRRDVWLRGAVFDRPSLPQTADAADG